MLRQVGEGFNTLIASPETSHSRCRIIGSLVVSLSRVSPSLLHLLAPRYRKSACATLAASLSMAHCLVQLNSYYISALYLSLTTMYHSPISSPPPASTAAGTRHESRSQACGPKEANARTQQSANACRMSGRAVTSFNSARVDASMFLIKN